MSAQENLHPAQFSKAHFEDIAQFVASRPDREAQAEHFAAAFVGTNGSYDYNRFKNAASTEGYRARSSGEPNYTHGQLERLAQTAKSAPGDIAGDLGSHLAQHTNNFNSSRWSKATS